jgi:hypothetical protein
MAISLKTNEVITKYITVFRDFPRIRELCPGIERAIAM